MKELHSQAPGGNKVETIRRHYLAFGCSGGVEVVDEMCFCIVYFSKSITVHIQYMNLFLGWMHSDYFVIVNID